MARPAMRFGVLVLGLLCVPPAPSSAEWHVKPFLGFTFGGGNTYIDPEDAAGEVKLALGASGTFLAEIFGVEGDVGHTRGFFQSGDGDLVVGSGVTTFTGNFVIAMPRRLTEYTLRPYLAAGGGLLRVRIDDDLGAPPIASHRPVLDFGGGVTGFLTDRIGLGWDVRYFRSIPGKTAGSGQSIGAEQLSFWRVNMALVIRFRNQST